MAYWFLMLLVAAAKLASVGGFRLIKAAGPQRQLILGERGVIRDLASIYHIERNEPHPKTIDAVRKHCNTWNVYLDNHSVAPHTVEAFGEACNFVRSFYNSTPSSSLKREVILDSGCGKGKSTRALAREFPSMPVIGIDRSVARLSHTNLYRKSDYGSDDNIGDDDEGDEDVDVGNKDDMMARPPNLLLVRAELADFWLLVAVQSDWYVHKHYLLYPNPYPKLKHLQRRWHGHPIFPAFLALGGEVVVRSNWKIYLEEMEMCMRFVHERNGECAAPKLGGGSVQLCNFTEYALDSPDEAITHFERKYVAARSPLYELRAHWGERAPEDRLRALGLL